LNRNAAVKEYIKFMDLSELEESSSFENIDIIGEYKTSVERIQQIINRQTLYDILYEVTNKTIHYEIVISKLYHD